MRDLHDSVDEFGDHDNQELNLTIYAANINFLHHLTLELPHSAFVSLNEPKLFFSSPHAEDALLAIMVLMDTMGYQAATVEMESKVRWA